MKNGNFFCYPLFASGDKVVSLVFHPPEIVSGTEATVIAPFTGTLCAVLLPNGELHRWFADFELQPAGKNVDCPLRIGDYATVKSNKEHGHGIEAGTTVRIAKVIPQSFFYELRLENGSLHRWLAEFEITYPIR
jgi:hypothetical protein